MQYQEPPIGRGTRFELRVEPVLLLYYLFLVAGLLVGGLFFVTNEVPEGIPAIPIDDSLLNVIWIWGGASAILLYLQMILSFRLSDSVRRASQDRKSRGKGRREEGAEKGAKESPSFYLPGKSERRTKRAAIATYLRDRARVYRATALGLRQSGPYEQAAAYRLEELTDERKADYLDALYGRWIVSSLLNLVAGYGERPARILITYLITILSFAAIYLGLNIGHISFGEALVLSLTSFHGRGFFNPSGMLSDTVAGIAAAEAVIGLLIEIVLIATLTRRFIPGS